MRGFALALAIVASGASLGLGAGCGRTPIPLGDKDVPPDSDLAGLPPPGSDLAEPFTPDLSQPPPPPPPPPDMSRLPPDMTHQKSCGEVLTCATLTCRFQPQCVLQMCVEGVPPETIQELFGLGICAFQHCAADFQGGQIDFPKLIACLAQSCPQQLGNCLPTGF